MRLKRFRKVQRCFRLAIRGFSRRLKELQDVLWRFQMRFRGFQNVSGGLSGAFQWCLWNITETLRNPLGCLETYLNAPKSPYESSWNPLQPCGTSWKTYETSLKRPVISSPKTHWIILETSEIPSKVFETSLIHHVPPWNAPERPLKPPWNILESPLTYNLVSRLL